MYLLDLPTRSFTYHSTGKEGCYAYINTEKKKTRKTLKFESEECKNAKERKKSPEIQWQVLPIYIHIYDLEQSLSSIR